MHSTFGSGNITPLKIKERGTSNLLLCANSLHLISLCHKANVVITSHGHDYFKEIKSMAEGK